MEELGKEGRTGEEEIRRKSLEVEHQEEVLQDFNHPLKQKFLTFFFMVYTHTHIFMVAKQTN